ncbi:outer membrane receptor for ferrienterochelin and colicins [Paracoccus pantotrophus]|nr:outer membrane receptor for ferrienterochelin and colicins [Paracoccus pantotrophus]
MTVVYPRLVSGTALSLLMSMGLIAQPIVAQTTEEDIIVLDTIVISAEDQGKQALGASTITSEDITKHPPVNDISEIVRKMPGVNLTGNSVSGTRGNNRQIDLRGMGPENTLILIDGKPVMSRNSIRMGRQAERDTRGDSNWVPAELIERIEVLRGPAAARYGSGAAGGVVNIITKRSDIFTGSVGMHANLPDSDLEGGSVRTNFMLAGPLGENWNFRVFGNYNKSDPDSIELNAEAAVEEGIETPYAGREGVVNKDIGLLLGWLPIDGHEVDFEFNFSRQGNRYAGDSAGGDVQPDVDGENLVGLETNRMLRRTLSATHRGEYGFGESHSYIQWENTRNTRNGTSATGGSTDDINTLDKSTITYDSVTAKSEWILPMTLGTRDSRLTFGAEYRGEFLDDENATQVSNVNDGQPLSDEQHMLGLYAEANVMWNDRLTLTPGLRYDYGDTFGSNLSPSLNATYEFSDEWSMKVGLARAFKAPNLFQLNPNYVYSTMGMGCPPGIETPCEIQGNPDLEAETSFNKEIGVAYNGYNGISASLTWFHNDYKNRIAPGFSDRGDRPGGGTILQWENTPEAVIEGIEGNFSTEFGGGEYAFNLNLTKMLESRDKRTGNALSLVPEHTVNASLDWYARDDLVFTVSATHYGKIEAARMAVHTGVEQTDLDERPSYTLVNLGMTWDVTDTAELSAGINNVFDKQLFRTGQGANTFNEPGRAFYVSLNKTF